MLTDIPKVKLIRLDERQGWLVINVCVCVF